MDLHESDCEGAEHHKTGHDPIVVMAEKDYFGIKLKYK